MAEWNWGWEIIPGTIVGIALIAYCWRDISRHSPRRLPRAVWYVITIITVPFGPIAYLIFGKDPARGQMSRLDDR